MPVSIHQSVFTVNMYYLLIMWRTDGNFCFKQVIASTTWYYNTVLEIVNLQRNTNLVAKTSSAYLWHKICNLEVGQACWPPSAAGLIIYRLRAGRCAFACAESSKFQWCQQTSDCSGGGCGHRTRLGERRLFELSEIRNWNDSCVVESSLLV